MAEDLRDILMKIEISKGKHIEAECTAVIEANPKVGAKDVLANSFTMQSLEGGRKTNYFAVDEFTFPLALIDVDDEEDEDRRRQRRQGEDIEELKAMVKAGADGKGMRPRRKPEFTTFMTGGSGGRKRSYPADLEQVTITKRFDVSSLTLFKHCRDSKTLFGASIIKRRPIGDQSLRTYLRIDFEDVLITDLSWEDDDIVREQFKFVCRKAEVTYCMEGASTDSVASTKLIQLQPRSWSMLNLKPTSK